MNGAQDSGAEASRNAHGRSFLPSFREVVAGLVGMAITSAVAFVVTLIPQLAPELPWLFFLHGPEESYFSTNGVQGEIYVPIKRNPHSPTPTYYRVNWKDQMVARGIEDTGSHEGLLLNFVNESGAKDPITIITNGIVLDQQIEQPPGIAPSPFAHPNLPENIKRLIAPHGTKQSKYKLISF